MFNGDGTLIDLYSTLPQSKLYDSGPEYLEVATRVAEWSDRQGCTGMLIYTDNSLVDPWLLAQMVLERTERPEGVQMGLRVGIVARDDAASAWSEAEARFPEDRKGQIMHELAMKTSDSQWHEHRYEPI